VQGVGFRPFVYNLAMQMNLKGYVSNDEFGVIILVQGKSELVSEFCKLIENKQPKSAKIQSITISEIQTKQQFDTFYIKPTEKNIVVDLPLTPDFAICDSCKTEILDSENPRYFYPFTTCTQCGPRYSITEKFPFERENTSINAFEMCTNCQSEYTNPKDIRFHSQTNSCPNCGIQISFTDNFGNIFSGSNKQIFENISKKLHQGAIVAIKNTSGYLLMCDATNLDAVQKLRNRKKRPTKPFAVLFSDFKQLSSYLNCNQNEETHLKSTEAPIVILTVKQQNDIALEQISPNITTIGAMLPNSGTLFLLSHIFNKPLIATSGNFHGSPICSDEEEAIILLKPIADYYLHNSLQIQHPQDDSVIKFSSQNQQKIILRRSRGFAPNYSFEKDKINNQKILCLGGDLKNTITIIPNNQCYISEYIGDLGNYETYNRFEKTIKNYQTIFSFSPEIIVRDEHPNYENNKIIAEFPNTEIVKVQHHTAHFAAILGERKLWHSDRNIMGIVWDGIGFGSETEIFGGEFFTYQNNKINRIAHLDYFSWIIGDKMSKNPKISALSISENDLYFQKYFDKNEWKLYTKLIKNASVKTSSIGRLFDAVAFVLGFENPISFEGEAGMYVEKLAQKALNENRPTTDYLENESCTNSIPTKKIVSQIILDVKANINPEIIALNFHYTLVKTIEKIAVFANASELAFSGGVFQNSVLIDLAINNLKQKYKLHFHEILSPNDENISFGQLNYYLNL
jgi:hydrogenase maturation protein HypF